jgi:CheY-like chemotaxis protein
VYFALTGYGQSSDRESSRQAGFDRHFVKPVEAARLLEALDARTNPA